MQWSIALQSDQTVEVTCTENTCGVESLSFDFSLLSTSLKEMICSFELITLGELRMYLKSLQSNNDSELRQSLKN